MSILMVVQIFIWRHLIIYTLFKYLNKECLRLEPSLLVDFNNSSDQCCVKNDSSIFYMEI